jgi:hypothetical protein
MALTDWLISEVEGYFMSGKKKFVDNIPMKNSIYWDMTRYRLLKVDRRFGGTHVSHLQGRRIRQARK